MIRGQRVLERSKGYVVFVQVHLNGDSHGRMNYKDTKPYMSAFLSVDLLTDFAAFCLTDFIDWRYSHSWFVFSTQLVSCCPPHGWGGTILVYCWVLPLYYTFSLTSSPHPPFPTYSIYRQCVTVGGGGGGWNVLWTIFCRSFTLCFWPDSEPTKLLHRPKQNDQWRRH